MSKEKRLTIRIEKDFKERIQKFCEKHDLSLTEFVIDSAKSYMNDYYDPVEKLDRRTGKIKDIVEEELAERKNEI